VNVVDKRPGTELYALLEIMGKNCQQMCEVARNLLSLSQDAGRGDFSKNLRALPFKDSLLIGTNFSQISISLDINLKFFANICLSKLQNTL
jgi:hypothetical protein